MTRRHRLDLITWIALLAVAAIEFGCSFIPMAPGTRPVLVLGAAVMAITVALGYMRLASAPHIAQGFAVAGVFWLTILLGLAMADPMTRAVYVVTGQLGG